MVPRVLVVQSRPELARAMRAALAGAALDVVVLAGGHGVMAAIETWRPHAVLVDLTLPALDGWYVLAEVRSLASPPLVVARLSRAEDVERAIALGADAWIDHDVHIVAASGRLAATIAA